MNYKATIILACYNKEKYIRRALDSLVELSRFRDFEIIVVDDCSTDGSVSIIEEYANRYSNIHLIKQEKGSGSPSRPRNIGVRKSTAEYVIFMDPDDIVINDGYSVLLSQMEKYRSDILIAARIGVNEDGVRVFTDFIDEQYTFVNEKNENIVLDLLNRRPFILKTIYSKKLIVDNGILFNEKICTSEDEAFDMRCVGYARTITKINDIVYQYTAEAEDSITTKVSLRLYEDLYDVMVELVDAYRISFSDELIAERLLALTDAFYISKLAFLSSFEEIEKACSLISDAYERFGFEKFSSLCSRQRADLLFAIKDRNLLPYAHMSFLRRLTKMQANEKKLSRTLESTKKKLKVATNLNNRKLVKPAVLVAKGIDKIKKACKGKVYDKAKDNHLKQLAELKSAEDASKKGYWVFFDRPKDAKDNAEALYRYVMNEGINKKIAFVLSPESSDYLRLKQEGFNLVEYNSLLHWQLLENADYFFTSHCDNYVLRPWHHLGTDRFQEAEKNYKIKSSYKLVFLQHGVIRSDMSSWLGTKVFHKIIASSPAEKKSLQSIPQYRLTEKQVALTGLARWDSLRDEKADVITIFPTWRKELNALKNIENNENLLAQHSFLKNWIDFCNSNTLQRLSEHYKINFITHHDNAFMSSFLRKHIKDFVNIVPYSEVLSFSDIVAQSRLLVTDYSSFSFDFLYLKKPVLYFDFERNALQNNCIGLEYEKFGYYCNTLEKAQEAIEEIEKAAFVLGDSQQRAIDNLFAYMDKENCKRIILEVLER